MENRQQESARMAKQAFTPDHNYLQPLPAVLKIVLAEYAKGDEKRRAELRQRNPDVDFSTIPTGALPPPPLALDN
jgi:hypothetical protein